MQLLIKAGARTDEAIDVAALMLKNNKGFVLSINLVSYGTWEDKWSLILSIQDVPTPDSPECKGMNESDLAQMRSFYVSGLAGIAHQFEKLHKFSVTYSGLDPNLLSEVLAFIDAMGKQN